MRTFNQFLLVVLSLMISTSTFAQLTSQLRNSTLTFREDTLSKAQIRYNGVDFFFDNNEFNGNAYVESRNDIELRTGLTPTARLFINEFGNIGMGTTTPNSSAILDINSMDKGILIPRVADINAVSLPVEGLLIYDSSQSQFSYYNGSEWIAFGGIGTSIEFGRLNGTTPNESNIAIGALNQALGTSNSAFGISNLTRETNSSAFGFSNETFEENSSAVGFSNETRGTNNSAFGYNNYTDVQNGSSAFGNGNAASGAFSSSFGAENRALSLFSSAFGNNNNATGIASNAFGYYNEVSTENSNAFGSNLISDVLKMTVIGINNEDPIGSDTLWIASDPIFAVGNGRAPSLRSTALTILKNGNTGIGTTTPSDRLHIVGSSDGGSALRIATGNISNLSDTKPGIFQRRLDGSFAGAMYADVEGETSAGADLTMQAEDDFRIYTNNNLANIRFYVGDGGSVGIGTDIPAQLLSVNGTAGKPGGGDWATFSDKRLKKNIQDFEDGLAQILQIRPVRFQYNGKANMPTEESYIGVVAQEMQKIAPYTIQSVAYGTEEKSKTKYLTYDGTAVTYMLVNAIQEQQELIEAKEEKIEALETRLARLEAILIQNEHPFIQKEQLSSARLKQNAPNPFNGKTSIQYYIPNSTDTAILRITNANGRIIKEMPIAEMGKGQIEFETSTLSEGNYFYSLLLDGQVFETKQMILQK